MGWEHKIARELKQRDNPNIPNYIIGTVVGAEPLRVSIYDGKVVLSGKQIKRIDPWVRCTAKDNGCTPQLGAPLAGMPPCRGCVMNGKAGECLEPRPLQVGQQVVLVGDQTYVVLGVAV